MTVVVMTVVVMMVLAFGEVGAWPETEPALDQLALGDWQEGRATFYGNAAYNGDAYSIDQGHCMYGGIPQPRYIAALSIWGGFGGDWRYTNCGRCFEIKCREGPRYNCRGDRLNASLIVMVTDKCPCNRWCCGDEPHFDLSFWGFGEIGNHGGGVISTSWRPIECPENMGKGGELVLNPQEYEPFCKKDDAKDIMAVAQKDKNLTFFTEALKKTHLDDDIEGRKRKYTVLAPTNSAFERAAKGFNTTVAELISKPFMKEVMENHLIVEDVTLANATSENSFEILRQRLKTLAGTELSVRSVEPVRPLSNAEAKEDGGTPEWLLIDQETLILEENVQACNGELDIVNKLILPYKNLCRQDGQGSLYDEAQKRGLKAFLDTASTSAGITDALKTMGRVTLFAPKNEAMEFMRTQQNGGVAEVDPRDFVFLGNIPLDHFEQNCSDISLADISSDLDALENVTNCRVASSLGLCNDPWIAAGFCPRTCGKCRPKEQLEVGFEIKSINGDIMKIYPSSDKDLAKRGPPFDLVVNGSMKITDFTDTCNGMLYVLETI